MDNVTKQDFRELDREVSQIGKDVSALNTQVRHINHNLSQLVSKAEFFPVKVIVYGLAAGSMGAVLTSVINAAVGK